MASPEKRRPTELFADNLLDSKRDVASLPPDSPTYSSFFAFLETRMMKGLLSNLNNSLKQSAFRRWVYYEWFYSNIDRALLLEENDFESCLQHLFKNLKTRMLTRSQWSIIRRMMGKPRRCSAAFFKEERHSLEEKRKKIRHLYQLKGLDVSDMLQFKELPEEIPMPMVVGTKVSAKVHPEGDGIRLFTGIVDAVDNVNNTYRVNFESEELGAHSIPDFEVASEKYESMNLQLFIVKERPKIVRLNEASHGGSLDEASPLKNPISFRLTEALQGNNISGTYGGFPIKFLLLMTRLSKLIVLKKTNVDKLKEFNQSVELQQSFKAPLNSEFRKNYAGVVLELDKINKELNTTFEEIHKFVQKLAPHGLSGHCEALKIEGDKVAAKLMASSKRIVNNQQVKSLITKLTSLMLHINQFAENNTSSNELYSLEAAVKDIKLGLHKENLKYFEDQIETNIEYLKNTLQGPHSSLSGFDGVAKQKQLVKQEEPDEFDDYIDEEEDDEEEIDDFSFQIS